MKKIILILMLMIFISGCAGPAGEPQREAPAGGPDTAAQRGDMPPVTGPGAEPQNIPEPPAGEVQLYKGFWMPCMFMDDKCQTMSDAKLLKEAGANIAAFGPNAMINPEGKVSFMRGDVPIEEQYRFMDKRMGEFAQRYYSEGIRIHMVIETMYVNDFSETTPAGGPTGFPKDAAAKPGFLDDYNDAVEEVAKIAEKYQVEMFSPMNEPDMKLGERASGWGQEILPSVKKHYHGKVLWKSANKLPSSGADFKGYDAIGIDISPGGGPIGNYENELSAALANFLGWAKRDNVPQVMFTEFGVWGGALSLSEEDKAEAHRMVFEKGRGKVKGFIALDPPPDLDRPLTGTKTLEAIKAGFKEGAKETEQETAKTEDLVEGKALSERLSILRTNLHTPGSGDEARKLFPDFVQTYVDHNKNPYFSMVIPFTYYYSEEADITVSICNIKMTVFICPGRLDRLIAESDYSRCQITDAYFHPESYSGGAR